MLKRLVTLVIHGIMHGKCCIDAALDTHLAILAEHITNNLFEIQQDVAN